MKKYIKVVVLFLLFLCQFHSPVLADNEPAKLVHQKERVQTLRQRVLALIDLAERNNRGDAMFILQELLVSADSILEKINSMINNEFAGWQDYENEELGFKFKFPGYWIVERCVKMNYAELKEIKMAECINITDPVVKRKSEMELGGPGFMSNLSIQVEKISNYGVENISEYINLLIVKEDTGITAEQVVRTSFLGEEAYIVFPIGHAGAEGIIVVVGKDSYLYSFIFGEYYYDSWVGTKGGFQFVSKGNFVLNYPESAGRVLSTFEFFQKKEGEMSKLVNCLAEKGVIIYGLKNCPACKILADKFGGHEAVDAIFVDCTEDRTSCISNKKTGYVPEIQIKGALHQGERDPATIASIVGCNL